LQKNLLLSNPFIIFLFVEIRLFHGKQPHNQIFESKLFQIKVRILSNFPSFYSSGSGILPGGHWDRNRSNDYHRGNVEHSCNPGHNRVNCGGSGRGHDLNGREHSGRVDRPPTNYLLMGSLHYLWGPGPGGLPNILPPD
jgi:hypothetical protein